MNSPTHPALTHTTSFACSSLATTSVRVTSRVVKVAVPPIRAVRQQVSKGVASRQRFGVGRKGSGV